MGSHTGTWCGRLALLLAVLSVAGCSPEAIRDERRELLRTWGDSFLLPQYRRLVEESGDLAHEVARQCERRSTPGSEPARRAWWRARGTLKRTEVFTLGPYTDEPLRLGPKLDFWPARVEAIEALLAAAPSPSQNTGDWNVGASLRGFPVVEYLLFDDVNRGSDADALERRCAFAQWAAQDIVTTAEALRDAWEPEAGGYLDEFLLAGQGSRHFDSLQMAVGAIVHRMAFLIEAIRSDKLGRPVGEKSGGVPQPQKAESRFSGRSAEDIRDNLEGVESLLLGDREAAQPGLAHYLESRGYDYSASMRRHLRDARAALDSLAGPVDDAVVERPRAVREAIVVLGEFQRFVQVDLLNALALTPVFSENDGD